MWMDEVTYSSIIFGQPEVIIQVKDIISWLLYWRPVEWSHILWHSKPSSYSLLHTFCVPKSFTYSSEVGAYRIFRHSAHESGKVVSPMLRTPLPPRRYPWYSFWLEAKLTQGYNAARRIKSMKNLSDPIGNCTCDLLAYRTVPQPTVPLHIRLLIYHRQYILLYKQTTKLAAKSVVSCSENWLWVSSITSYVCGSVFGHQPLFFPPEMVYT